MNITTRSMNVTFDEKKAAFISIQKRDNKDRLQEMEFLLTPDEFPDYDVCRGRWLGNVFLTMSCQGKSVCVDTGSSEDTRKIQLHKDIISILYEKDSINEHGIKGVRFSASYEIKEEGIYWNMEILNPSKEAIHINKVGIPLLMNQYFRGGNYVKYDKCSLRHTCITHHHSYIYWSKSSGNMPILYLQALGDTPMVNFSCEKEDLVFGRKGNMEEAFEGCFYVYPVHEKTEYSHISSSELLLESGEKKLYRFFIGMADSFDEMEKQIIANGGIAVKSLPGMCVPAGDEVHLLIRANSAPQVCLQEKDDKFCGMSEKKGVYVVKLRLGGFGIRNIWIKKENTIMMLQFFGIEVPGNIILKQAEFIAEKQFETEESDPCYHGLLMWDMTVKKRVNTSCNPFGPDWFAGGSDEIGLVSGLFLSGKNVHQPKENQIRILNAYVRDFLEKRLTEQPGSKVHRMVPWFQMFEPWSGYGADDIWRAFNYVHVINTFYNMYLISKQYEYSFLEKPVYYAKQIYHYMRGMFTYWMFPDGIGATRFANMGEMHMALSLEAVLIEEGLLQEALWVKETIETKARFFASQEYPYGSEMPYDSTAFEAVYAYGKAIGDKRVMKMTKDVTCANRGRQPIWYLYQTDLRQMGDSSWNISYMTQLGAYSMYDWLFEQRSASPEEDFQSKKEKIELIEAWYASYLAGWSIYNSGGFWSREQENEGASGWIVDGDMGNFTGMRDENSPYLKGLVPMSGESALGFYGALQIAAAVIVEHPVLGRYGFGCKIYFEEGKEVIIPTDGLGIRIYHLIDGWSLKLDRDSINKIKREGNTLILYVENHTKDEHVLNIRFRFGNREEIIIEEMKEKEAMIKVSNFIQSGQAE